MAWGTKNISWEIDSMSYARLSLKQLDRINDRNKRLAQLDRRIWWVTQIIHHSGGLTPRRTRAVRVFNELHEEMNRIVDNLQAIPK